MAGLEPQSDCALKGWHPGEAAVQEIIHLPARVHISAVTSRLPEQHRLFHTTRLDFLPITTLDARGRPWASVLTPVWRDAPFITSPDDRHLTVDASVWEGDPGIRNLRMGEGKKEEGERVLFSALGIEVATRRRNKFAGYVEGVKVKGNELSLDIAVNEALGLCPKYINVRHLLPYPNTHPRVLDQNLEMAPGDRLPPHVIEYIQNADTSFLGTSYVAPHEIKDDYPSHVGMNHRGGRPGFVRVRPSDGRTIVLPNYNGNRLLNSLGNIYITPLASLVFPSFHDGSILYLTGRAKTHFGAPAQEIMPSMNVLTTIQVTGYSFVHDALTVRSTPESVPPERSPYSPPIRYLAEETPPKESWADTTVTLIRARVHSNSLTTLTFATSRAVHIDPSRNAVLDLTSFIRGRSHALVDWTEDESTTNDDCVRTWTVSIPPTDAEPKVFSITMRTISGGLITPILYKIAAEHEHGGDLTHLGITAPLRGIGGTLPVPDPVPTCDGARTLLWVAGGIGLTPFLSLTRYVARHVAGGVGVWDIAVVVSTREPEVMLRLIAEALEELSGLEMGAEMSKRLTYKVHMFSPRPPELESASMRAFGLPEFVGVHQHQGRIAADGELFTELRAKEREVQICGPLPFVQNAMGAMERAGVDPEGVKRERFTY